MCLQVPRKGEESVSFGPWFRGFSHFWCTWIATFLLHVQQIFFLIFKYYSISLLVPVAWYLACGLIGTEPRGRFSRVRGSEVKSTFSPDERGGTRKTKSKGKKRKKRKWMPPCCHHLFRLLCMYFCGKESGSSIFVPLFFSYSRTDVWWDNCTACALTSTTLKRHDKWNGCVGRQVTFVVHWIFHERISLDV